MKRILILITITILITLSNCDSFFKVEYYGTNKSDKIIVLKFFTSSMNDSVVYELYPGDYEKQLIIKEGVALAGGPTGGIKKFDCCPCFFNFIKLEVKDKSNTVTKDGMNKNNWSFKIVRSFKKGDKVNCYFEIEQSDLK
jgi:hypothetical protein